MLLLGIGTMIGTTIGDKLGSQTYVFRSYFPYAVQPEAL